MRQKSILLSALAILFSGISVSINGQDFTDGLVGYWPLDEGDGASTADLSGFGNHGELINGVEWIEEGIMGSALLFNGEDGIVDCGNDISLEPGPGDFTISAWIRTTGGSTDGSIFSKGGDDGGGIRYQIAVVGSNIKVIVDDDIAKKDPAGEIVVTDSIWHHVVGLRTDLNLRLYIDGLEDIALTNHGRSVLEEGYDVSNTVFNAYLGAITSNNDVTGGTLIKYYKGIIDEVAVWNRALEVDEIIDLYNLGDGYQITDHDLSINPNIVNPGTFKLVNFPNPFSSSTVFSFHLQKSSKVNLSIYNSLGQQVLTLINSIQPAGENKIRFEKNSLQSGIYIACLQDGENTQSLKFIIE